MKKSHIEVGYKPALSLSRRANLISGISAIVALHALPTLAYAGSAQFVSLGGIAEASRSNSLEGLQQRTACAPSTADAAASVPLRGLIGNEASDFGSMLNCSVDQVQHLVQTGSASDGPEVSQIRDVDGGYRVSSPSQMQNTGNHYDINVRADGHAAEPVIAVHLIGGERVITKGKAAQFRAFTNYPSFVVLGQVRIFASDATPDAQPLAVVPTDNNGIANWLPDSEVPRDLFYVFRVYDQHGRFDETKPKELTVLPQAVENDARSSDRPTFSVVDEAATRNIQLNRAATITVSGKADPSLESVRVIGQIIPINPDGKFITQQLVSRDTQNIAVAVEKAGQLTFSTTRDVVIPSSDWFIIGQGDLTFRSLNGSNTAIQVSGDPLADGNSLTSRAAFYAKGRFRNGWNLTASMDTGETLLDNILSNLDRKDPRQLLRRLNSNEHYTTYGDDSVLVEDAPTQGQFYLKVQKADTGFMIGNYVINMHQAELAQLDRGLFGAALDHKSIATTSFGERQTQVTLFASDPGTLPGRDEFRGTGGSLYFLKRQDLTIGSERLRIEVRDRETGIVLETRELRPQEDYDIDYFQGRVTLFRPLGSTSFSDSAVRDGGSSGNIPVLVARYEYTPTVASLDGYTLGGRGAAWLGDRVRIGLTAQKETTDTADQTLLGVDAMLRIAAGIYIKGEIAQTNGPAFGQANSVDGGLSFTDIAAPGVVGREARAWRVEAGIDFAEMRGLSGELGKASAYFENFDAGFAAASQLTQSDTTRWGATLALPIGNDANASVKYEELKSASAGAHRVVSLDLVRNFFSEMDLKLGLRQDEQAPGLLFNSTEVGTRTDAALELNYGPEDKNWSLYGFGQLTLQADAGRSGNNRFGAGIKSDITERVSLSAELSGGDGGLGADAQLSRRNGEGSESYIGYSLLADRADTGLEPASVFASPNRGTLTIGGRQRFNSALSIYSENRISQVGNAPTTMHSFGANYDPDERFSFSASFENGKIDDATTGIFRRTAVTLGLGYTTDILQLGSNVEARFERSTGRDQTAWLFRNSASIQVNSNWRALGRLNVAITDDDRKSLRAADYVEAVAGLTYRPVKNDRFNLLARVNYFQDLGPVGQITSAGETNSPKQRSAIGVIDVNYDLSRSLTIGGKYGYRQGRVSLDRASDEFVSSNTHLAIARLDWRPVKQWDAVIEARFLTNDLAGDAKWGGIAAIYRHLGNNAKIGVGYSISDFSDDLTDQSYSSKGFFVNLLGKF